MNIVFTSYIWTPEYNQPEKWLKRIQGYTGILESLSKMDTVISIERINYEGKHSLNGVQYIFFNQGKKISRFPKRLHRLIKSLRPDTVVVHGLHFPLQIIQLRTALDKNVKIIVQHHAEKPFQGFKKILQRLADPVIDSYFFTAHEMGTEWVQKGIIANEKKIVEVMEASSIFQPVEKTLAQSKTNASGEPVFLWVGRLDENKDPLTVVKAFLRFVKLEPGARLYMIYHTEGLKGEIEKIIYADPALKNSVTLVGKTNHDEMGDWFSSADFIISGSHYEGSGVAVCEAMSCGCIPVVTDILSFRKMTGQGKCGLLYEPGNENGLLSVLLQTRQLDKKIEREKVLRQFNEELSFEAIAAKIHLAASE